jgi:hypothetical protein
MVSSYEKEMQIWMEENLLEAGVVLIVLLFLVAFFMN